jgi:hypothetical protein
MMQLEERPFKSSSTAARSEVDDERVSATARSNKLPSWSYASASGDAFLPE